jgi:dephospho-CoA kinase
MTMKKQKVGITGGIGSGKTTVCKIFETLGIPVYYADERAKWLMAHDEELKAAIIETFGSQAYTDDDSLNRVYLAEMVFGDEQQLQRLNALVHPAVGRDAEAWHERQRQAPYTLKEAALLFESGSFRQLDKVITVFAPRELRLQRVMQRDGATQEQVEARMARQLPEEEKVRRADYVIYNDGRAPLVRQVWEIHLALTGNHPSTENDLS